MLKPEKANDIMVNEGDKAPQIDLPATPGGRFDLAAADGPVVVFFYPKDDTPGCTVEAIDFSAHLQEFRDIGVSLVGISPDPIAKHEKFTSKHNLTVPLASDEEKSVLQAYGVWVEKSMYGKTYMGVERSTFVIGSDGTIKKVWRKVKPKGHADAVLQEIKSMREG